MTKARNADAVVLLSGGLDSSVALYWAMSHWQQVHAVTVEYGQRHWIEIPTARFIAGRAYVEHHIVTLGAKGVGMGSLLTAMTGEITEAASVVPGRNLMLLWAAGVYAKARGASHIVMGAVREDQAAYADCRPETLSAMATALTLGLEHELVVVAPFAELTKLEVLRAAAELGCLDAARASWSCYDPQPGPAPPGALANRIDDKVPCEVCPACLKRAAAWKAFEASSR